MVPAKVENFQKPLALPTYWPYLVSSFCGGVIVVYASNVQTRLASQAMPGCCQERFVA